MGSPVSIKTPWVKTPLIESSNLSKAAGCRIFLKLDNLQPGTSFKSRGVGNVMLSHAQVNASSPKPLHFYISSGGNAGLACVTAASALGYSASVVLPTSTEESMILRLKAAGATEVIQHGASWANADNYLRTTIIPQAEAKGIHGIYVPPFDDPKVWEGNSTIISEIEAQIPEGEAPDAIICSVGGGGLFSGIMQGIDRAGWQDHTKVLAVETAGAESLAKSVQAGQLITLDGITSIATSLGAVRVAEQAFKQALRPHVQTVVLEDAEAAMGCWRFADDERILVEPACGVSVALAYDGRLQQLLKDRFRPDAKVVIIVCGGCRVSLADLQLWKERYGERAKKLGVMSLERQKVPSSVTAQ